MLEPISGISSFVTSRSSSILGSGKLLVGIALPPPLVYRSINGDQTWRIVGEDPAYKDKNGRVKLR
jgi:hypothetical protein